jgi:hypothetical protein
MTKSNQGSADHDRTDKNPVPPLKKNYGEEGTNKTQPQPDPHAKPSDVGVGGKFIEPTPFRR